MNWTFWRKNRQPSITVKVGDVLTIAEFGQEVKIRITGLISDRIYYQNLEYGNEFLMTKSDLRRSIIDRSKIRTEIQI